MKNEDIDTIIEHLDRLTLQQQQLTQQIAELQHEVRSRQQNIVQDDNRDTSEQIPVREPERTRVRKRPIQVGDRVRVKNPGRNQPNTGIVHSYTPSRLFVRIQLDNCDLVINRAPRNVTCIEL
jgi:hypothetical protein